MKDIIYREDAINCLCNGKCLDEMRWCDDGYCPPVTRIKQLPSAQSERMRGKWIKMSDVDGDYYVCDQCGEELPSYTTESPTWDNPYPPKYSIDKTNFCPNCGADMRGES